MDGEFVPPRFIVVGCGSMGRRRTRHARKLAAAEVGVWDVRDDRMAEVAAEGPVHRLGGPQDFAGFGAQGLFICVPPSSHEDYIDWAMAHDTPFMVEQPISHRPDRLDHILATVRARGIAAHVSNNHRFSAEFAVLRRIVEDGSLGRLLSVIVERGEYLPDWHPYEPYTDYYPSKRAMGGGLDAVCDLSWLRTLLGEVVEARSLCAKVSDLDIDTYDVAQLLLRYENGVHVALLTDMLQRSYAGSVKLVFERGTAVHTAPDPFVRVFDVAARTWREEPLDDGRTGHASMQGKANFNFVEPMYERDSAHFLDLLSAGRTDTTSLEDGIANVRTVTALVAYSMPG